MNKISVKEEEIQRIIDEEWNECEKVLSAFAHTKGIPLSDLKRNKFLMKPSPELVVWNCRGFWKDSIRDIDEESLLELLSVKIAGRVMEKVCKGIVS